MTLQRAIKVLKKSKNNIISDRLSEQDQAVKMSILALEEKLAMEEPEPLTLKELEERIGEPILVECNVRGFESTFWAFLHNVCDEDPEVAYISTDGYSCVSYNKEYSFYDRKNMGDLI